MPDELLDLVHAYLADARYVTDEMRSAYHVQDLLKAYREHKIPREGTVGDNIVFKFHGGGCRILFGPREINVEFGPSDSFDVFDAWRLWQYSATSPKFAGITTEVVQQQIDELEQRGIVTKLTPSSLYQLGRNV
jgi:hypothetical protein